MNENQTGFGEHETGSVVENRKDPHRITTIIHTVDRTSTRSTIAIGR
jgi:hypothetical protein